MSVSDTASSFISEARAAAKAKFTDRKVEERKQPEVMKVLQMAAVAAKKVKKKKMSSCSTEPKLIIRIFFSNKKRPIERLHV